MIMFLRTYGSSCTPKNNRVRTENGSDETQGRTRLIHPRWLLIITSQLTPVKPHLAETSPILSAARWGWTFDIPLPATASRELREQACIGAALNGDASM